MCDKYHGPLQGTHYTRAQGAVSDNIIELSLFGGVSTRILWAVPGAEILSANDQHSLRVGPPSGLVVAKCRHCGVDCNSERAQRKGIGTTLASLREPILDV